MSVIINKYSVLFHYLFAVSWYEPDSRNYTFQKTKFQYHEKESSMKILPIRLKKPFEFIWSFLILSQFFWMFVLENKLWDLVALLTKQFWALYPKVESPPSW